MKKSGLPLCLFVLIFGSACLDKDGRATLDVLKKCLTSDSLGNQLIYLGPSNQVGPGAIYRKRSDGKWALRRRLKDALPSDVLAKVVLTGSEATCSGRFSVSRDFVGEFAGLLRHQLRAAENVVVSIDSCAIDQIIEGPFEDEIVERLPANFFGTITGMPPIQEGEERKKFAATAAYVTELLDNNNVILRSAVRVRGLSAEIQFSRETAGELRPSASPEQVPTVRPGVKASWADKSTLVLKSTTEVYLFGERAQGVKKQDSAGGTVIGFFPSLPTTRRRPIPKPL